MVSRRNLLTGTALGAGLVLGARAANALTTEEVPASSGIGLSLSNRCGGAGEHAQILANLQARLRAEGAAPGTVETVTCPICGCPITAYAGG